MKESKIHDAFINGTHAQSGELYRIPETPEDTAYFLGQLLTQHNSLRTRIVALEMAEPEYEIITRRKRS